jgi:hypothetical protein
VESIECIFYKRKLQNCPNVTRSQSGVCSDFSESTIVLIWCEFDILYCLDMMWILYSALSCYDANLIYCIVLIWCEFELINEKSELIGKIIGRWINQNDKFTISFILMWSDLAFVLQGASFWMLVIINTSDIPGARISDPCADRGW